MEVRSEGLMVKCEFQNTELWCQMQYAVCSTKLWVVFPVKEQVQVVDSQEAPDKGREV